MITENTKQAKRTDQGPDDFTLTYPDVQRLLNRSRRYIQQLVAEGKLERRMVYSDKGKVAYFSASQVKKLGQELGVKHRGETPERELERYKGGMGALLPQIEMMKTLSEKKDAEIASLAEKAGRAEGRLEEVLKRLAAIEKEKTDLYGKLKQLEPQVEELRESLHEREKAELQSAQVQTEQKLKTVEEAANFRIKALASWTLFLIAALILLGFFFAPQLDQFRQSVFSL